MKYDMNLLLDIMKVMGSCQKVKIITENKVIEGYIDHMNDGEYVWVYHYFRGIGNGLYEQVHLRNIREIVRF